MRSRRPSSLERLRAAAIRFEFLMGSAFVLSGSNLCHQLSFPPFGCFENLPKACNIWDNLVRE